MKRIKTPCLIYFRSSSKRFPKKVFCRIYDEPLYRVMYKRLSYVFENTCILTSTAETDDDLAMKLEEERIPFYRGELESTLIRTYDYLKHKEIKNFFRVCGDSPLYPVDILQNLDNAINLNCENLMITNVYPQRQWPKGWSIELVSKVLLEKAVRDKNLSKEDHEHLTPWMYRNAQYNGIRMVQLKNPKVNLNNINLVIDHPEDMVMINNIEKKWFDPKTYMKEGSKKFLHNQIKFQKGEMYGSSNKGDLDNFLDI